MLYETGRLLIVWAQCLRVVSGLPTRDELRMTEHVRFEGDIPHEGDCIGSLCPDCGCCQHCVNSCPCVGCESEECMCSVI